MTNAHVNAARTDGTQLMPDEVGAVGPPGFELLIEPVLTGPAEHELDDTTTENVLDVALSVVLKVTPVSTIT